MDHSILSKAKARGGDIVSTWPLNRTCGSVLNRLDAGVNNLGRLWSIKSESLGRKNLPDQIFNLSTPRKHALSARPPNYSS
jgi:hypothetical protein